MVLEHWGNEEKAAVKALNKKQEDRLNAIIAMNILICDMCDERAWSVWITYAVPDGASAWDFIDFAKNENGEFDEAVRLFKQLWKGYAAEEAGLFIGGKTY